MISCALALQILIGSVCSSYFGILADRWDANSDGCRGRLWIMFGGLAVSTVATLMHLIASEFNTDYESEVVYISNNYLVFHLVIRCIFSMGVSATSPVLNGLTLSRLERDGRDSSEFGKERLYGAVSWGLANSFFGAAIDVWNFKIVYATTLLSFVGCGITFYLYARADDAIIAVKSARDEQCCMEDSIECKDGSSQFDQNTNSREHNIEEEKEFSDEGDIHMNTSNSIQSNNPGDEESPKNFSFSFILTTIHNQPSPALNISYIIAIFALYIGMSVVENLIFLYFEFLGGSNTLCGLTVAVTVLFELPIFHYAPDILKWMQSPIWMFQWGCLAYVVRVVGYSIIPESHALWVLILEPLHGVTIGFVLTGSVAFVDGLMPKGYESSGQGFLSSIMGLGQFVGLCIGAAVEGRELYRVLAGIVSFGSLILAIGQHLSARLGIERGNTPNGMELKTMKKKVTKSKLTDVLHQMQGKATMKRKCSDVAYAVVDEPVSGTPDFEIS